jgi:hypothetical protein
MFKHALVLPQEAAYGQPARGAAPREPPQRGGRPSSGCFPERSGDGVFASLLAYHYAIVAARTGPRRRRSCFAAGDQAAPHWPPTRRRWSTTARPKRPSCRFAGHAEADAAATRHAMGTASSARRYPGFCGQLRRKPWCTGRARWHTWDFGIRRTRVRRFVAAQIANVHRSARFAAARLCTLDAGGRGGGRCGTGGRRRSAKTLVWS